jgi:hypothetical protein
MKRLDNVTLITVDGVNPELCRRLLNHCKQQIEFKKTKLISFKKPEGELGDIEFHQVPRFSHDVHDQSKGANDYNEFIVNKLYQYVDTDFVLIVQTDGFINHPSLWSDEFLDYDYLGSPWPNQAHVTGCKWVDPGVVTQMLCQPKGVNLVGGGGFSLRSKKIINLAHECPRELRGPEDVYYCLNNYDYFISHGIRYAPVNVAERFSRDDDGRVHDNCFGFHGNREHIHNILK